MNLRDGVAEALLIEALDQAAPDGTSASVLLLGPQACTTVEAASRRFGAPNVVLLHLDRAAGGVGCGLGNQEAYVSSETLAPRAEGATRYKLVAVNVEAAKSYRLLREIIAALPGYVERDGTVLVAGPKKGGADVAATALREIFESVTLLAYRKGQRVYRATGPRAAMDQSATPAESDGAGADAGLPAATLPVSLRGHDLRLLQDERIFARGRLDPATAMLAACFQVRAGSAVLDLGCGGGVLGILAALLEPTSTVTLADADPLAVEVSRRNAALNGAENVTVHLSDVLRELPGQTFDLILTNPPFHQGRTHDVGIAHRFIKEASAALRPGGQLYVVCNRFLRYEPIMQQQLGAATEVAGDRQYKVLLGQRRA